MLLLVVGGSNGQELASNYYDISCPKALSLIRSSVLGAVHKDRRMGASLLRLHFHDCFVNGCDGSVLLDDTANFTGEKTAGPNMNSLRGFEVIDSIKLQMESVCPGVVSCADILTVAARDSVVALGGPSWNVQLGRRDSTTASYNAARNNDTLSPLDAVSPSLFDNAYFTNVLAKQGLLHSDQQLFSGGSTDAHVTDYGKRPRAFYADFAAAMVKMGGLGTLTGTAGEVRANCRRIN
ncbi:Cationic peroxidase 1 [Linum perenne]